MSELADQVADLKLARFEDGITCDYDLWSIWTHGWVDKRKFKGQCISRARAGYLDSVSDVEELAIKQVVTAKVRHGWIITIAGDMSGCGWDTTMYLRQTKPEVVDGRWTGEEFYDEDGNIDPTGGQVVDGPHMVTYLEVQH